MTFKEYKGLDLTETGNVVLERWKKIHAFEKSLSVREGAPEFIFFEGPPSANGMPLKMILFLYMIFLQVMLFFI